MRISRPDGVLVIVSKYKQFRVNFDMNTCNCAEKKKSIVKIEETIFNCPIMN